MPVNRWSVAISEQTESEHQNLGYECSASLAETG